LLLSCRPGYLTANFSGPAKYKSQSNSHFNPWAALFSAKQRWDVFVSDIGFFGMIAILAYLGQLFGSANVVFYYVLPYLVVNMNLVLITFLQHTDTYIPHYREPQFTWLRGALSTVDRSFGWVLDAAFHHIADTHVAHHLFHEMPWYHAQEATEAIKKVLGPYYLYDPTPIPQAVYNSWKTCKFVEDKGDVIFYKGAAEFNEAKSK
jgi:omega-6 fatty acid desaturase (delta-12 desaturase)